MMKNVLITVTDLSNHIPSCRCILKYEDMDSDLSSCRLCERRCGVDRLKGERGVCRVGRAEVAATMCSPSLSSYIVTLLGCCYRCLHCNAYRISQYPDPGWQYAGHIPPAQLVADAGERISSFEGSPMKYISFTGGDPIIHLPYIEEVSREIVRQGLDCETGISTGGFATTETMSRIIERCGIGTLEIKAFSDHLHRALTGAPVGPVLRNAEYLVREGRQKIRVCRTVVIPGMTDHEVPAIAEYIASLDPTIPYRLIGFRPNNVLYYHPGPSEKDMETLCRICRNAGLCDVEWSGYYPTAVPEKIAYRAEKLTGSYGGDTSATLAAAYAAECGCPTHPRNCGTCSCRDHCPAP